MSKQFKDKKILIIGFGMIGSRHAQSLLDSGEADEGAEDDELEAEEEEEEAEGEGGRINLALPSPSVSTSGGM